MTGAHSVTFKSLLIAMMSRDCHLILYIKIAA